MLQVSPEAQLAIVVQLAQAVSLLPEQPPATYCPLAQLEQAMQLSGVPSTRKLPPVQAVHCESAALVQVTAEAQPATAVQAVQLPVPSP